MKDYTTEKYLQTLIQQLRSKKARELVETEIKNHIEDQILDYQQQGMTEEQAMTAAVKDMGDPVETGVALDRIHRPRTAWGMIFLMGIITISSILAQAMIFSAFSGARRSYFYHVAGNLAGFCLMFLIYRLDYSRIGRHARSFAVSTLVLFTGLWLFGGVTINGAVRYVSFRGIHFFLPPLLYLYVPAYGALLFHYRNEERKGIIKSLLWAMIPFLLAWELTSSVSTALALFYTLILLFSLAVGKHWFNLKKIKLFLSCMWTVLLAGPLLFLFLFFDHLHSFRQDRILAFLLQNGQNYTANLLTGIWHASHFWGNAGLSGGSETDAILIPSYESDYMVTALASTGGILASLLAGILILLLILTIFFICHRQKNQLGRIMGYGCGLVLLLQTIINFGVNLGLLPIVATTLPFFSYGNSSLLVSYGLMGIVLSIYRYQSLLKPEL